MTDSTWTLDAAQAATRACTEQLAADLLGTSSFRCDRTSDTLPDDIHGAHLSLLDGNTTLEVGVFSHEAGAVCLTRALLQFEPEDPDPEPDDVVDAVGEIVNVLAGMLKEQLSAPGAPSTMGLPTYVAGGGLRWRGEVCSLHFDLDGCPMTVTLVLAQARDEASATRCAS